MLQFYRPEFEELTYRQSLLADKATMSYNDKWGGTIDFPRESWEPWYQWWLGDEGPCFYRYLYSDTLKTFVGDAAYRYDPHCDAHMVSIIVEAKHRGKGFGTEALSLLIDAAKENGVTKLCDDIAIDNPSVNLFLRAGFTEAWRDENMVMVELVL